MSRRTKKPANTQRRKILRETPLTGLVSVSILQRVQDAAADTRGVSVNIRDLAGKPVTRPSRPDRFCRIVMESEYGESRVRESYSKALKKVSAGAKMFAFKSGTHLLHAVAPIVVQGERVACLVMSSPPKKVLSARQLATLARKTGIAADELGFALAESSPWTPEEVERSKVFLRSVANTVGWLCVQGAILRGKLSELEALFDVTSLLAATLDLRKALKLIARSAVEVIGAKGCSVRLLGPRRQRLEIKSYYNLSRRYLSKGAVALENSPIDLAALEGEVVQMPDMLNDPRVLYPDEARREGLRSGISLGLTGKRQSVGTLHVYKEEEGGFTQDEVRVLQALASHAAVAITNAQLHHESQEKRKIERELRVAGELQSQLLPDSAPELPGLDVAAFALPCRQVGGDFYDFVPTREGKTAIIIGDVAGKGVPAALHMASARAAIRAYLERTNRPSSAVHRLNVFLSHDVRGGLFVTLFCGVLDRSCKTLHYCNGGHNPPLLIRDGECVSLETGGLVLGVDEDEWYETGTVKLRVGDMLAFYTDGITEAENVKGELFGLDRLIHALQRKPDDTAQEIVTRTANAVKRFERGCEQSDDMTMVVLRVL